MTSKAVKKGKCGVFIDGANLFSSQYSAGWWISFMDLKKYLKDRYKPQFYNYYACEDTQSTEEKYRKSADAQIRFFKKLSGMGYNMITRQLKKIPCGNGKSIYKCDMDIQIALDVDKSFKDVDVVVLFTGDSDFLPVVENAFAAGKYVRIYSFKGHLSWELKNFALNHPRCNFFYLDDLRSKFDRALVDPQVIDKKTEKV